MLILSRRAEEKFIIGDDVVVKILDVKDNQVLIEIEAPKHIAIKLEKGSKKNPQYK